MVSTSETELQTQSHTCLRKNSSFYTKYSDAIAQITLNPTTQLTHGWTVISALLDLSRYINSIYGTGHFTYIATCTLDIPEIQYDIDRKSFKPRDIHIDTKLLEQALEVLQFLIMFAEDPEKPEHESTERKLFHTTRVTTT